MRDSYVVDWQDSSEAKPVNPVVMLRMQGRKVGLYRVKQVLRDGVLLYQGAISFPVGTRLDIEGPDAPLPGVMHDALVVGNDQHGLSLTW